MLLDKSAEGENPAFCISISRDDPTGIRYDLVSFTPTYEGKPVDFSYTATASVLTVTAGQGKLEVCFDPVGDVIRFKSTTGMGAEFFINFSTHELFVDRLNGSVEIGFTSMGGMLFETLKGSQTHDNVWVGPKMCATPTTISWMPADGELEGYVCWSTEYVEKKAPADFDVCAAQGQKDLEAWLAKFPAAPAKYATVRDAAGYITWICNQKPIWRLKEGGMYMSRCGAGQRSVAWLQCLAAMAAKDQKLAFDLLHNYFAMQDELGAIPGSADERIVEYGIPVSPMQGLAAIRILDQFGDENVDPKQCERLYAPLCSWVNWWKTYRCGSNGLMSYHLPDEIAIGSCPAVWNVKPIQSPDLQAYMVLCLEACGRLAGILGDAAAAKSYAAEAEALTAKMVEQLWDGDCFVCMYDGGKKTVNPHSVLSYIPVILGKRLPQEILTKLVKHLADPRKYFTAHGFVTESLDSPIVKARGACCSAAQAVLTVALAAAGEKELAAKNAENWCGTCLELGVPAAGLRECACSGKVYSVTEKIPGSFSSLGGIAFFLLAELLDA